jgi:hypothetical protein
LTSTRSAATGWDERTNQQGEVDITATALTIIFNGGSWRWMIGQEQSKVHVVRCHLVLIAFISESSSSIVVHWNGGLTLFSPREVDNCES